MSTISSIVLATQTSLLKNEETDFIVLSIREELMARVMEECSSSYLKKQTIKFLVQCAYEAMVKFLSFNFYYHPEPPDVKQFIWAPDEPVPPSPKDSWASDAVPIRPSEFEPVEEEEILVKEPIFMQNLSRMANKAAIGSSATDQCLCSEHECTCLKSPQKHWEANELEQETKVHQKKIKTISTRSSKETLITESSASFPKTETPKPQKRSELASNKETTMPEKLKLKRVLKSQTPKTLEEVAPPLPAVHSPQGGLIQLPPMRADSKFSSKAVEAKKKKNTNLF